jgi:hypothetical protein
MADGSNLTASLSGQFGLPARLDSRSALEPQGSRRVEGVRAALAGATSYSYTSGSTHHFYHYPARFAPPIAREVLTSFSTPGDLVLDPFMGGGTTIIEGLALGRRLIGVDLNALAHFVTKVRTLPITSKDEIAIRLWARLVGETVTSPDTSWIDPAPVRNLPTPVATFMSGALTLAVGLSRRQRDFARCALLRLGQWALDCRDFVAPRRKRLGRRLPFLVDEMIDGLRSFTSNCLSTGLTTQAIAHSRILLHRSAVGMENEPVFRGRYTRPKLVFTSPPYPGVNVLYHRWQYRGRKETPAPYWIANVPDGFGSSFYTGGSRTPTGLNNYFDMITSAFRSVVKVIDRDAIVVQLVGFSDSEGQLPRYLDAMERAGLEECHIDGGRLGRRVPNRKWYAKLKGAVDASTEVLLIHRPSRSWT